MRLASYISCIITPALVPPAYCTQDTNYRPVRICPLPKCKCPSIQRATGPAVGVALEIGYGTASIKYNNGTIAPVTKIGGSPQYVELMQRLATSPITSMPDGSRAPPGMDERDPHTLNIWIRNKIKSWARKLIFLPATPEVAILADMVSQLRREAEAVLGQRVKGVAIASPDCVRLARYEIGDILDYLWMEDLVAEKTKTMFDQLFSLAAASAGYGDGLCPSYMDAYECEREEQDFLELWTLQLDFGHQSLSGALDRTSKARHLWAHDDFVDLELGASYRPHEGSALEQEYWNRVRTRIRDFVESKHRSERLYLTGDSASEPRFLEVVKTALMDIVSPSVLEALDYTLSMTSSEHYLFATSKGAAEFAKRRQEGMALCQLPEECRGRTYHRTPTESKEL